MSRGFGSAISLHPAFIERTLVVNWLIGLGDTAQGHCGYAARSRGQLTSNGRSWHRGERLQNLKGKRTLLLRRQLVNRLQDRLTAQRWHHAAPGLDLRAWRGRLSELRVKR